MDTDLILQELFDKVDEKVDNYNLYELYENLFNEIDRNEEINKKNEEICHNNKENNEIINEISENNEINKHIYYTTYVRGGKGNPVIVGFTSRVGDNYTGNYDRMDIAHNKGSIYDKYDSFEYCANEYRRTPKSKPIPKPIPRTSVRSGRWITGKYLNKMKAVLHEIFNT